MDVRSLVPFGRRGALTARNGGSDPFLSFRREMDRMFDDFFGADGWPAHISEASFSPRLDVEETDSELVVRADLPGIDDKDIDISLAGDLLTIKGERKEEHAGGSEGRRVVERRYGAFERTVSLPFEPEGEVDASFKDGVLTLKLAKPAELKREPRKISIRKT